jgi:hypothetical protein
MPSPLPATIVEEIRHQACLSPATVRSLRRIIAARLIAKRRPPPTPFSVRVFGRVDRHLVNRDLHQLGDRWRRAR